MSEELVSWFVGVATSAGLIGFIAYLLRDALASLFAKTIEHQFDKKLEVFKADIRL